MITTPPNTTHLIPVPHNTTTVYKNKLDTNEINTNKINTIKIDTNKRDTNKNRYLTILSDLPLFIYFLNIVKALSYAAVIRLFCKMLCAR